MMNQRKPTTDALEIINRRFYEGQPERIAELKDARADEAIARLVGVSNTFEIILSAQVQKSWRVEPASRASDSPRHWLSQWRVDIARKPGSASVALVTNTATLYTLVFPARGLGKDGTFEKLFRRRLGMSIAESPSLAAWNVAPLNFVIGNPRRAVGAMTNLRQLMVWRAETPGPTDNDKEWINNTPFLTLPGSFPNRAFASRLAEAEGKKIDPLPLRVKAPQRVINK